MNWPEIWAHHVEQRLQSGSLWLGAGCRHALFGFHGLGLCNVFKTVELCANQFTLKEKPFHFHPPFKMFHGNMELLLVHCDSVCCVFRMGQVCLFP